MLGIKVNLMEMSVVTFESLTCEKKDAYSISSVITTPTILELHKMVGVKSKKVRTSVRDTV